MSSWNLHITIQSESSVLAERRTYDNIEDIMRFMNKIMNRYPNEKVTFIIKPTDNTYNNIKCT